MIRLQTPRQVLAEIDKATNRPWWASRLMKRIERQLTETQFQGKPVIDTPMSMAACEAVLEEALNFVRMPGNDPLDDMLKDMRDDAARKTYVFGKTFGNA